MAIADIRGAYDLHIHSKPCLFDRIGDDLDLGRHATETGLSGILLKSHFESTVGRAAIAHKAVQGARIFGGLVLNHFTGGLNPVAVEHAAKLGAKEVWMPTVDSAAHSKVYGHVGGFGYQESGTKVPREGITVLAKDQLKEEVKIILEVARDYQVILGTGHLNKAEIYSLVRFARELKFDRLLVTHPFFNPPSLTIAEVVELASLGAKVEFCGGNLYPIPRAVPIENYRDAVRAVGAQSIILTSDAGQYRKSLPAEVLRLFAQCLLEKGTSQTEIDRMVKENPDFLLGI
jgi:hypothetical protein